MDAQLLSQLQRHEGAVRDATGLHRAYRCSAGALTIGYGHNLDLNPVPGISAASRLTEDQAVRLLTADMATAKDAVARLLPWAERLEPARLAVLVNMAFNLGPSGLLSFTNTLAAVRRGDYADAAKRMLASTWARQVKGRAVELAEQMRTGVWQCR